MNLYEDFGNAMEFVSVYVREAHPGENYPHHTNSDQKMRHARDWVSQDKMPWTVAVDDVQGSTHRFYQPLPNAVYLIDRTGRVAFRALWAGQEGLLRKRIEEFLARQSRGEEQINLGEQENLVIPLIRGAAEFDHAVARGGQKSKEDFRLEMGNVMYAMERLMSRMEPLINPGNRDIEAYRYEPRLWKGLVAGIAGGLAGAYAMNEFQTLWSKLQSSQGNGQSQESQESARASEREQQEPATVKAASAISEGLLEHRLTEEGKETAGPAVHYAMGATSGAVYGALAEHFPQVTIGAGVPFGGAVWLVADELAVPAAGLSKSPTEYPLSSHAYALASHFVYGLTTDLVRRTVRQLL
jgi:hypothetical protein